jgi:hypothetical protein
LDTKQSRAKIKNQVVARVLAERLHHIDAEFHRLGCDDHLGDVALVVRVLHRTMFPQ